jgi:hypothetical protein
MNDATFTKALLHDTNFFLASMKNTLLQETVAESAVFQKANLQDATFRESNLRKADLGGTNLAGAVFVGADLTDASFFQATLIDTRLKGATGLAPVQLCHARTLWRAKLDPAIKEKTMDICSWLFEDPFQDRKSALLGTNSDDRNREWNFDGFGMGRYRDGHWLFEEDYIEKLRNEEKKEMARGNPLNLSPRNPDLRLYRYDPEIQK